MENFTGKIAAKLKSEFNHNKVEPKNRHFPTFEEYVSRVKNHSNGCPCCNHVPTSFESKSDDQNLVEFERNHQENSSTIQNHPKCIQETSISTASLESKSTLKDFISSPHVIKEKSTNSKVKHHCSREKSLSNNYQELKNDNCQIIRHSESQSSESSIIKLRVDCADGTSSTEKSSHKFELTKHRSKSEYSNCSRKQDWEEINPSTSSNQKNEPSTLNRTLRKEDKSGNNLKEYFSPKPQNDCEALNNNREISLAKYSESSLLHLKPHSPQQELFAAKQVESKKNSRVVSSSSKNCSKAVLKTCSSKSTKATKANMGQGDVGSCCAKYILCMFNFVFFILGSLVLGLGLWLLFDKDSILALMKNVNSEHIDRFTEPQLVDQTVYIFIVIGSLMFVLGFLGYCGALRESQCLLSLYGVCLIILLVLEIVLFVFAVAYQDVVKDETESFLKTTIKEYKSSGKEKDGVTLMWNQLMAQFKCCGVNSYADFETSPFWLTNRGSRNVPEACCHLSDKALITPSDLNCPYSPSDENSYYMKVRLFVNFIDFYKSLSRAMRQTIMNIENL
ncbi:unnamed protein product [Chironomus riparius]|uniref:Tetraspanin n=1 Tax=Chironomus riparius TaxID=315576 RepID=A0A9P0NG40_9DIPT|nr:unnamed protein product [Chironomus riparius]